MANLDLDAIRTAARAQIGFLPSTVLQLVDEVERQRGLLEAARLHLEKWGPSVLESFDVRNAAVREAKAAIEQRDSALAERDLARAQLEQWRNQFICLECGLGQKADEDGCCSGCGRDCLIVEDGELRNADAVIAGLADGGAS